MRAPSYLEKFRDNQFKPECPSQFLITRCDSSKSSFESCPVPPCLHHHAPAAWLPLAVARSRTLELHLHSAEPANSSVHNAMRWSRDGFPIAPTRCYSSTTLLPTLLTLLALCIHDLYPHDLFHQSYVACFALNHAFQILQAVAKILHLPLIEILRIHNSLLDKEACAHVY